MQSLLWLMDLASALSMAARRLSWHGHHLTALFLATRSVAIRRKVRRDCPALPFNGVLQEIL